MTSPHTPDRPEQGGDTPAWGSSTPEQPDGQQPAAPTWGAEAQPAGWPQQPQAAGWAAPPTLVAPVPPAQAPQFPQTGPFGSPAPAPVPPAPLLVAAVLAVLGAVGAVLLALNGAADLLDAAGWRAAEADALPALLVVPLLAALAGGLVAALAGRGGGLLLTGGVLLAVSAGAVAVGSGLVDDVDAGRIGLAGATAALGIAVAVLAVLAPSKRWYRAAERRSAERVVTRVLAGQARRDQVAGVGVGWAVAAALLALATVGAAALVVSGQSDDGDAGGGQEAGGFGSGSSSDAGSIPVDESDSEYDPYLHDLAEDCQDGDFDACDSLYAQTPVGSDYEAYGKSCGGRTSEDHYGTCSEEFG